MENNYENWLLRRDRIPAEIVIDYPRYFSWNLNPHDSLGVRRQ